MPTRQPDKSVDEINVAITEGTDVAINDDHEDFVEHPDEASVASLSARQLDAQYSAQYHIPKKLKRRYELIDSDTLLSVRYLKQFFFFGSKIHNQKLKAVSNVSFDVHKGECFGIVGESGCGKTTTGRTIIKLYDATSGSVYYRGYRISAGARWNKKEIKWSRIKSKKKIKDIEEELDKQLAALPELDPTAAAKVSDLTAAKDAKIASLKEECKKELSSIPEPDESVLAGLKSEHEANLARIDEEIAAKFDEIKKSLEDAKIELDQRVADLDGKKAAAKEKYSGTDDATKQKLSQTLTDIAAEKGVAKGEYKTKSQHARYLNITTRADRAERIDNENARYQEALDALDEKSKVEEKYELQIAEVEEKFVEEAGQIDPSIKLRADAEKEIQGIKDALRENIAEQHRKIRQIRYDNGHTPKKLLNEIQMIFQDPVDSLDPRMTVEDIIQEGLRIQGHHNRAANHKKVVEMLEKVGLVAEHASRYPHEFSGGQRQRIGIARALVMNPQLLICDEPISALDVSIRAQIINLLNDLKDEMGLTIIFIAHDLSVVKYFCNRIAVMYFGKLVELTTSDELFRHPLHPYTVSLLSAIPKPNPLTEKERVRILYNPATAHDYSVDKPDLREVCPGHVVYCNQAEFEQYQKRIKELDAEAAKQAK